MLEFLGDSVIGLTAASHLIRVRPEFCEGELSRSKAAIISQKHLSEMARNMELEKHLRISAGLVKSNPRALEVALADAFEALVGAVFLDQGPAKAMEWAADKLKLHELDTNAMTAADYKTRLQEHTQKSYRQVPDYNLIRVEGKPPYRQTFWVECRILCKPDFLVTGCGPSRKLAELAAAGEALRRLGAL